MDILDWVLWVQQNLFVSSLIVLGMFLLAVFMFVHSN